MTVKYKKSKIKLHTLSAKYKEIWFELFDELLKLKEARSIEEAEHAVSDEALYWLSNRFLTFEQQMDWVKNGIQFYLAVGKEPLNKISIS